MAYATSHQRDAGSIELCFYAVVFSVNFLKSFGFVITENIHSPSSDYKTKRFQEEKPKATEKCEAIQAALRQLLTFKESLQSVYLRIFDRW